ncbi:MAG TPA: FAD-dependent oxidoreductase [Gemmatimonadaceae bacterium]|nr:FAD-dependent oxidoreductase [Gemmatimonadaceae bacterium]
MRDAQVVVVGGGPAGSSAAYFMARAGLDVVILDRARFPRDKPCSEYMSPQASRILEEMGALSAVESSGAAQLTGMRVHAPNGATIHGEFLADHGYRGYRDRGLAVRRTVLDAILLERAREAGARVIEGVRVTDVVRDVSGRVIGVRTNCALRDYTAGSGLNCGPRNSDQSGPADANKLFADMIIGADGLRSVVGRRLGLIRSSRWPRRIALVTHYRKVRGVHRFGEMHVDRGGYLGIADVGNGLANVAVVVPVSRAAEIAADRTEFFESWIAERPRIAELFTAAERVDPVQATGPFASAARRAWTPGAALVGDAADFFDPFTGEGIYTALRGGELLAGHVVQSMADRRSAARSAGDAAIRAYDGVRRAEFSGKWRVERLVGAAIAFPALINRAANVLSRRRDMADLLVGVVGDFVPAREVLSPRYLLRLLLPAPAGGA